MLESCLRKLREEIQSVDLLERRVAELNELCINDITDKRIEPANSLLFDQQLGVVQFLHKNVTLFPDIKAKLLEFLSKYVERVGKKIQPYVLDLKNVCLYSYNQDKAAKVKNASIVLLVLVFEVAAPKQLPDLNINNLFEKFYSEIMSNKVVNTVRANIYRLLGAISEYCPEYMQDYVEELVKVFLTSIKDEMNAKNRKPEFAIIAASLEGMNFCLVKHTPFADEDSPEIYNLLHYTRNAINPDATLTRYDMPKAGLNLFARHCALFSHFLIDIYEEMYDTLFRWCHHKNRELWILGQNAMEGFITQMSKILTFGEVEDRRQSSIFKFFVKKFHAIMVNNQAGRNDVTLAVRSYGLLAAPCKKFLSIEDVRVMFREILRRCRQQFEGDGEEYKDQLYNLPSYLEALASIVKELDYVSEESLITLERLLVLMLEHFPQVVVRRQFISIKAAIKLMLALMPMETVFREFLSEAVYQGLIRTCSHSVLEDESSTDSVPGTNFKKQITYKNYMNLWSGLLDSANNKELALIGYSQEVRNRLTELLYDEIMSSLLRILKRLDLSVVQAGTLVQPESSEKDSASTSHSTIDSMESADPVFGLKPNRLQDHLIFLNLVNFTSDFLPKNKSQMFERWILQFTESIVTFSSSHTLISGFYKLLAVIMKLATKLTYFKDIDVVQVNISEVQDRNMKERIICFILMKKFTKEVLVQMKQYKDDLLASCLILVLSLPAELIANQLKDLVPAAQLALSLGVSYLPLAIIGMDALEYWSKILPTEVLQPIYPDILPYLDSYLRSSEKGADDVSLDPAASTTKSKSSIRKKVVLHSTKKKTQRVEYKSELGLIKLRILNYLGNIGGSANRNLLANTQKEISEHAAVWDIEKHLKFDFPFVDMRPTIYFDSFLPHLLELATKSSDRQTKSAACEFLHSLVVFSLGRAAQKSRQTKQRAPMEKLYRKLFPALLQLACDVEPVSRQLYETLVFQLIHWFTSNSKSESEESMSLLDVIYDGITQFADTALRDFSARCLSEYLKWSIKQLTPKMLEKDPVNVKSLLKCMYNYALYPDPFKRLGAALAFNNFYTIFREYETLVDQFIFNILVHFVKSLAISHSDEKSLGVHIQCNKALDHLERIIIKKADLLMKVNNQRKEPSYWTQVTLDYAVRWLVRQCGRPQTECRHACMKLVYKLAPYIQGIKSTKEYFNIFLKKEGPKYFLFRFEGGGDGAIPGESLTDCPTLENKETFNLQETCQWFECILAALDCYIWVFDDDLLTSAEMFVDIGSESTKIFHALCYFLEHVTFFSAQEMAAKNKGDLDESIYFTPREQEKFNRIKCTVIVRLFNFLAVVLQQCHRLQFDYSFIPENIWSKFLWKTLSDCILSATKLGFDLGDVEIMNKLPIEMKEVLGTFLKFLCSKHSESLKVFLHNDLKEERNLMKLLPTDLKEIKLNFYDLQQMICGYSLLSQVGFLKKDDSEQLAENIFLNVFKNIVCKSANGELKSTLLTPVEFELTKSMLELALKLPLPLNTYMKVILDKSPFGSQKQGELQFTLYKEQMINYIIQNRSTIVPLLIEKANVDGHFIGHILIETLDYLSRDRTLRKGAGIQMCTTLLNNWKHFECWWKVDANVDYQTLALSFLTKILLIDSQVLSDVNQSACNQIHQMFYSLLNNKKSTLAFKSNVLDILPFLCVTPEPFSSQLQECLENFVADSFPLSSQEFSPHSPPYNDYISALDKILMALKLTQSPMLLKLLIRIFCREEKHIHEAAILKVLESFIKRVSNCEQQQFAEIPFNLAMKEESCPVKILKSAILKVCLPLLRVLSKTALIEFFCCNISYIMDVLESKIIKWSEDKLERQLTEKLCCFQILQVMYFRLEKDEVNSKLSSINKAYCEGKELNGNELTKTITKISHKIKSENMHGETLCLETYRQLHCAAYNLLISIISCTQTDQKFYSAFLFSENEAKSEYLLDNLIDKKRTYTFPVEIQPHLEKKNTFVSVREELRSLRRKKIDGMDSGQPSGSYHLSSVYLADSSLSADFGRYDFTTTASHLTFTSNIEEEYSQDQKLTPTTSSDQSEEPENVDTDTGYALLEMDELNQHEVMAPLVALLRHMQNVNITPKVPVGQKCSEMPPWMEKLHKKMTANSTHVNVKIFIVKLILNTAEIFEAYASFWLTPLCELIVSGALGYNSLSYFTTDIIITLLSWHKIAIPQNTIEDRALVSQLLNFIFTNIYHETRSIFRENLEMLKTVLECWKERIDISYGIIYNKLIAFDAKSMESMSGIQLIGVILSCQIAPYAVTDEVSQKQFFSCLAKGFQHHYKAVYTATAEVFGLILKYYFEQQPDLVDDIFEIILPTINQMQIKQPDKFIICLHKMQRHYSQAAKQHLSQLLFLLPKVHGEFRVQCLEILHGSISNYENIFLELKSKGLLSFLSHRNEDTQLVTLRIVKSLLPKLQPSDMEYLLSALNDLILHPSIKCRKLTYDLFMWIYDNYSEEESRESNKLYYSAKDALLRGLADEDIHCRLLVQNFWSSNDRLPEGTLDRIAAILKLMYSPKTENRFLNYATNLILEMTSKSPEYNRKIYEFPLSECKFQEYKLQSSWQQRHATMTPLFISSQVSGNNEGETMEIGYIQATVDPSHKEYTDTQDIKAPFNWLTQSSLDTFAETDMDVEVSSSLLFTQASTVTSAVSAPLSTRKKPGSEFGKYKLGAKSAVPTSNQKQNETGDSRSDRFRLRRRFLKDHEEKRIFFAKRQIRLNEMRAKVRQDQQRKREHQVTIYRKYRTGELPDIQIEYSSIIAPLQAVAERDSTIAKLLFSSIFKGIFKKMSSIKAEKESKIFTKEICENFNKILNMSTEYFPPFIGCILNILCDLNTELPVRSDIIVRSALASNLHSLGIVLLEERLIRTSGDSSGQKSKRSRHVHSEPPMDMMTWIDLARLYKANKEHDALLGIFKEQISSQEQSYNAINAEICGQYSHAIKLYNEALSNLEHSNEDHFETETKFWSSCLIQCLENLTQWNEIESECMKRISSENGSVDNIWENNEYQDLYLSPFIKSKLKLLQQGDPRQQTLLSFIDNAMAIPERRDVLERQFSKDLSMMFLLQENYSRALHYMQDALTTFLEDWQSTDVLMYPNRVCMLQNLQTLIENQEFLKFISDEKNFTSLDNVKHLLDHWGQRTPSVLEDSVVIWNDVIMNRLAYLKKFRAVREKNLAGESMDTDEKNCFHQNKLKLQLMIVHNSCAQNNFKLALNVLKKTFETDTESLKLEWSHLYAETHQKKAALNTNWTHSTFSDFMTVFSNLGKQNSSQLLQEKPCFQRRHNILYAQCYELLASKFLEQNDLNFENLPPNIKQKILNCVGVEKQISEKALIENLIRRGYEYIQKGVRFQTEDDDTDPASLAATDNKGQACLIVAKYCDTFLQASEEDTLSKSAVYKFPEMMVKSLFSAIRYDILEARQRFCRLLQLLEQHPDIMDNFVIEAEKTPCWMFLMWINQIMSLVDKPESKAIQSILMKMTNLYPQAVVYSFKTSQEGFKFTATPQGKDSESFVQKLDYLLGPEKLISVQNFINSLEQLSNPLNIFADWCNDMKLILQKPQPDRQKLVGLYSVMYKKLFCYPETKRRAYDSLTSLENFGSYRQNFAKEFRSEFDGLFGKNGEKLKSMDCQDINRCLSKLQKVKNFQAQPQSLREYSAWLANYDPLQNNLEIPGQYHGLTKPLPEYHIKIAGFNQKVVTFKSLRKPRKIIIHGNDEKDYAYVVKGGEDLRQDQRIQILFDRMNQIFRTDSASKSRNLYLKTYQVIPMSTRIGMIEFLNDVSTLKEVFEQNLELLDQTRSYINAAKRYIEIFKEFGDSSAAGPYISLYMKCNRTQVQQNLNNAASLVPWDLLRQSFLRMSTSPEAFHVLRTNFALSYAVICVCHYILGVGDRHLSNIMINRSSGQMIGIDFGHAFGSATQFLPVPELMPFRLTKQILNVFLPHQTKGILEGTMTCAINALRSDKELLLLMMDIFIKDPSVDWLQNAQKQKQTNEISDEEDMTWYPREKIDFIKRKLFGENPCYITRDEVKLGHSKKTAYQNMELVVLGDKKYNIRAKLPQKFLTCDQQVSALIDQATDPAILGRTWKGWEPFM